MTSARALLGPESPWTRADAIRAAAAVAAGCVVWSIGWYRVANEGAFDSQLAAMNLAVFGLAVACAGHLLWFLGGRRAVDVRRRVLLGDDATVAARAAVTEELDSYVGGERLYHRPDCPLAQGRDWRATPRADQERAGRVPCGWCEP